MDFRVRPWFKHLDRLLHFSEFGFSHLGSNYPNGSNLLGLLGGLNEIMHEKCLPHNVAHVSASSKGHQGILRGSI